MSDLPAHASHVIRGLQLKELGRYADAENAFRTALAQEPNDAFALHHLAGCQFQLAERRKEALQTIENAIAIEPNEADHHVLRGFILCALDRPKEGLIAAQTALRLEPQSDAAFTTMAQAWLQLQKWPEAETAARQALAIDGDNSSAANQLAQALRLQNKMVENEGHLAGMLARDPEDPFTHANAGWSALQSGRPGEAEAHFREALRLDPDFESAREGLLNSFRARSPVYRGYLKYCFAMQRLSSASRWAVIIGLYLGAKFGSRIQGPIGITVVAVYMLFVLWVWVARPFGNLMLLADRFARHALRKNEKIEAAIVGGGLCAGALLLALGLGTGSDIALVAGIGLIAQAFPSALTFTNTSRFGSWLFGAVSALTMLATLACVFTEFAPAFSAVTANAFLIACIACLACTWLGNVPALRRQA